MGVSSSKTKTKSDPYAPAVPAINTGLQQVQDVNAQQQPHLQQMADVLQNGFAQIAPGAFGTNNFVLGAQGAASNFANGAYVGNNPGASTYTRLQQPANDPSMGILASYAGGAKSPGSYDGFGGTNPAMGALASLAGGSGAWSEGANPGDAFASSVAGGKYLNAQPSSDLYGRIMGSEYLSQSNPYLDGIVAKSGETARNAISDRFSQSGLGEGVSSAYTSLLGKTLADSENSLRYTDYNDRSNRQLTAAGQSDAAFANERGQMTTATGQLSSNFNAAQDRSLSARNSDQASRLAAANSLGGFYDTGQNRGLAAQQAKDSAFNADRGSAITAAGQLGSRYDAANATALDAAKAGDAAHSDQLQQQLAALGLVPGLANAQYAGVNPALSLATGAATLPYAGTSQYADILKSLTGGFGTTTSTTSGLGAITGALGSLGGLMQGAGSLGVRV